mgnify:CR=1 FL=1
MQNPEMTLRVIGALANGYKQCHAEFLSDVKVVESEQDFTVPILNPDTGAPSKSVVMYGVVDKLIHVGGALWVIDHKTASRMPEREYLRINAQGDIYLLAYRCRAYECTGIIWDYVRKPQIKQTQKESEADYITRLSEDIAARPEFYFLQVMSKRWQEDLKASAIDTWQTHTMLMDCHRRNIWPRNTGACNGIYGTCEYLQVCAEDNELTRGAYEKRVRRVPESSKRVESYSSLQCFRTCPKKYWWAYIEAIQPIVEKECFGFGRAFHAALDVVYAGGSVDDHIAAEIEKLHNSGVIETPVF